METIVDTIKLEIKNKINTEYKQLLKDANMKAVTTDCPVITEEAIDEYLRYLVMKKYPTYKEPKYSGFFVTKKTFCAVPTEIKEVRRATIDTSGFSGFFCRYYRGTYDNTMLCWIETPIENFVGLPPKHVLESIKEKKDLFDEIVVVTIDEKTMINDPLICGRRKNDPNRYLIDWYDNDIDITEISIK